MFSLTMLLLLVGFFAGLLAGLFGIGGGLIIVPVMTFLLLAQGLGAELVVPTAIATSLASMLMTSASAVWAHRKRIGFDRSTLLALAPGVVVGSAIGAAATVHVPTVALSFVFALVASLVGIQMAGSFTPNQSEVTAQPRGGVWLSPLIGGVSSLVGIGGGSMLVPYLVWNGYQTVQAVALASAIGWLLALVATLTTWVLNAHLLNLSYVLAVGLAGLVGAPIGVSIAHRMSSTRLRRLFGLMLVALALRLFWQIYTAT